jgi:hypothetical protein
MISVTCYQGNGSATGADFLLKKEDIRPLLA